MHSNRPNPAADTRSRVGVLMHPTRIDLSAEARSRLVPLLNRGLADAIDLHLQAKQAHWNVRPGFIALHELFDRIAGEIDGHVDELAERVTALGGTAEGTLQAVADRSRLAAYPLTIADGCAHLESLAGALAAFGEATRVAIDEAAQAGDADTSDLFTGISRAVDKNLWLVEAHLQADR